MTWQCSGIWVVVKTDHYHAPFTEQRYRCGQTSKMFLSNAKCCEGCQAGSRDGEIPRVSVRGGLPDEAAFTPRLDQVTRSCADLGEGARD